MENWCSWVSTAGQDFFKGICRTRKETIELGGERFTYIYDAAGQLTLLQNPDNNRTTFQYDDAGRRTGIIRGNGTRTTHVYDNASQTTETLQRNSADTILTPFTYTYYNAGIPTSEFESGPVTVA